ncbi:hypothetical protein SAFG77S_04618 [Streptomyces afghaniensis]
MRWSLSRPGRWRRPGRSPWRRLSVSGKPPGFDGSMRRFRSRSLPRSLTTATSARPVEVRKPVTRSTLLTSAGRRPRRADGPAKRASRSYTRRPPSLAVAMTRLRPGSAALRQIAGSSASELPPASSSCRAGVSLTGVTCWHPRRRPRPGAGSGGRAGRCPGRGRRFCAECGGFSQPLPWSMSGTGPSCGGNLARRRL